MSQPANSPQHAIQAARHQIRAYLGADQVKALHRPLPALDALAVISTLLLATANSAWLATLPPVLWLAAGALLQGWLIQLAGLVSHDLFVHRRVGGERWSQFGALLLTLPRLSLPVGYETAHLCHHRHLGSEQDSEQYKQALTSRRRRLLFSTLLGVRLVQARKLDQGRHYHDVSGASAANRARAVRERWLLRLWLLLMIVLTVIWPAQMAWAYWIPLLVVAPVINSIRLVLEHADADVRSGDAWQLGTWYRTGPVSRLLFLWDSGDCHLVHHIFPRMPFYHVGACVDALTPLIERHNPRPHRSLAKLLYGWYVLALPHRQPWPGPAGAGRPAASGETV